VVERVRGLVMWLTAARQGRSRSPGARLGGYAASEGDSAVLGRGVSKSRRERRDAATSSVRADGEGRREGRTTGTYSKERATDSRRGKDVEKGKERTAHGACTSTLSAGSSLDC
jgi:hypothetical protein